MSVLFVTLLNGKIVFVSDAMEGRNNDQGIWNQLKLRNKFIGKSYGIMVDKMFTFNRKRDTNNIIGIAPIKKNQSADKPIQDVVIFNKSVSSYRVTIEHTFAKIKDWAVLSHRFRHHSLDRHNIFDFSQIIRVVCSMHVWKEQLDAAYSSPITRKAFEYQLNELN